MPDPKSLRRRRQRPSHFPGKGTSVKNESFYRKNTFFVWAVFPVIVIVLFLMSINSYDSYRTPSKSESRPSGTGSNVIGSSGSSGSKYAPHIRKVNASNDCVYLNEHWISAKAFVASKHDRGIAGYDEVNYMYAVDDRMDDVGC
jgi:hypothetical protein